MEEYHKEHKGKSNKMNYIVLSLVIFLLLFSVFQAFQINEMKQQFVNTGLSLSGGAIQSNVIRQSTPQTTPTMVGGC